jgi:hypothetical protein
VKRADDVLDRMLVNVKLPKPSEPPRVEKTDDESDAGDKAPG